MSKCVKQRVQKCQKSVQTCQKKCPNVSKKVSKRVKKVSKRVKKCPNVSKNGPNVSKKCPNVSKSVQTCHKMSKRVKKVSKRVKKVSKRVKKVSKRVKNVSKRVKKVSNRVRKCPNVSKKIAIFFRLVRSKIISSFFSRRSELSLHKIRQKNSLKWWNGSIKIHFRNPPCDQTKLEGTLYYQDSCSSPWRDFEITVWRVYLLVAFRREVEVRCLKFQHEPKCAARRHPGKHHEKYKNYPEEKKMHFITKTCWKEKVFFWWFNFWWRWVRKIEVFAFDFPANCTEFWADFWEVLLKSIVQDGLIPHGHFEKYFLVGGGNSWQNFTKNALKNEQRQEKSIATTFIVQTHRNQNLSPKWFLT